MNNLQLRQLKIFCRKHELDGHLIDDTLTYSENKDYLKSQIPDFNPESRLDEWDSAEEEYLSNHFLWYYMFCMKDGSNKSEEVGSVPQSTQEFSLRNMKSIQPQKFTLKTLLQSA
jgi:hypothetical protein